MAEKIIDKLVDLEYNEQVALAIVERDEDLRTIFLDESKAKSFILLKQLIKENALKEETREFLRQIFDQVICTKQSLVDMYMHLLNGGTAELPKVEESVVVEVIEPVAKKVEVIVAEKVTKPKAEKEVPRRYGREAILRDIEAQGGKATNVQLTALETNELKNIYVNLSNRLIKDMFSNNIKLTDEEYRVIRSTITIIKNKIKPILSKK